MLRLSILFRSLTAGALALTLGAWMTPAEADIPDALFDALGVSRDAAPNVLYDALVKRYYDPEQGFGKGSFAEFWEPIPITKYIAPGVFYEPPELDFDVRRGDCIACHTQVTPGWVHSWDKSVHAKLDEIRNLPDDDVRAYKKEIVEQVETNLHSMGLLEADAELDQVQCIDCHIAPMAEKGNHAKDIRLPDAAACGQCHLQQFAERESERDTMDWPQDQWPDGRPSHALDWKANVETAIWAAMEERDIAAGCSFCHINQNRCDGCHTRHEFSAAEARKPEACSTCHNGVDHPEFEAYMLSKHGTLYRTHGDEWNWEARLEDAMELGGLTAPTCQYCHMSYQGEFGHNVTRKVRWAFNPTPEIAENLDHPWFEERRDAWLQTCQTCHSGRFAKAYLEGADRGIIEALDLQQETGKIVTALYDDGLLVGQQTNRPAPPEPAKDGPGGFYALFWAEGNNPSYIDYQYAEMWEQDLLQHYKSIVHAHPGGYTYSSGWSKMIEKYALIQDTNTRIREMAALKEKVATLSEEKRGDILDLDSPLQRGSVGGLGALLLLVGAGLFWRARRNGGAA